MNASVLDVVEYISRKQPWDGRVALNKFAYYAQGWYLAWTGKPLFAERIEAWSMGPVVPDAFRYLKHERHLLKRGNADAVVGEQAAAIDAVLEVYGRFSGTYLVELTHKETPWITARQGLAQDAQSNVEITKRSMRSYVAGRVGTADAPSFVTTCASADLDAVRATADKQALIFERTLKLLAE